MSVARETIAYRLLLRVPVVPRTVVVRIAAEADHAARCGVEAGRQMHVLAVHRLGRHRLRMLERRERIVRWRERWSPVLRRQTSRA